MTCVDNYVYHVGYMKKNKNNLRENNNKNNFILQRS